MSARTESVETRVNNPQAAAFGLRRALLLRADGTRSCLSDVTVAPQNGADLQYVRFGLDPVTITVDDAAVQLLPRQGMAMPKWAGSLRPPVQLLLDPADPGCASPKLVRLPLAGTLVALGDDASFSNDPKSPRLVLLSGTVRMLVRAIKGYSRAGRSDAEGADEDELFSVDDMVLPPGSAIHKARDHDGHPADWWGFVDVMFGEAEQRGLQVEASSHAGSVTVTLPAAVRRNGGAADQRSLSVDFVQRWSGDPTLRLVALLSAGIGLLCTIGVALLELLHSVSGKAAE